MQIARFLPEFRAAQPLHGLTIAASPEEQAAAGKPWLAVLILTIVFSAAYYFLLYNKALVELELETDTRTVLKLYWPNQHGQYSEKLMAQTTIKPGVTKYAVWTTDISQLEHMRFDPSEKPANITIRRIAFQQRGFPLWQLRNSVDFVANLRPVAGVDSMTMLPEGGVKLLLNSKDSQTELAIPRMERQIAWPEEIGHGMAALLLALLCIQSCRALSRRLDFIPLLGVFAFALIVVMASISAYNTHPDEYVHIAAAEYHKTHLLPPKVGDPAAAGTYSLYGVSRLHSGEIYYLLAGKFLQILDPLQLPTYTAQRCFNVLLFFGLLLFAAGRAQFRPFFLPLLISPQIWYIFSYCNSDAFAAVIGLIAAWQLAAENSAFNRLLRDEPDQRGWLAALCLALLFALLLLEKKNFYFLYLFFLGYFFWRHLLAPPTWNKRTLARFITIILCGGMLFAAVKITDAWVNDFKKDELVLAAREQYAEPIYKPSTPIEKKHIYLQMRDKGRTLRQMLELDRWGEKSFRTAFGVYGYTQYSAPFSYYEYVRIVGLLLLLTLVVSVCWRGGLPGLSLLTLAAGGAGLLLAALIWHAWTVDFQAQGRYLLPLVPMLAMLSYHCQRLVLKPVFYGLFFILFLLSVYNFVFVGLYEIGKAGL
ncbi:hypothetical protein [Candidatus Electronema sp. JM]|uniref:hypothetical protein n=1 Tax=Candidatus Electronema sp. JM TaxID=3401571 RepID=UPI003AA82E15